MILTMTKYHEILLRDSPLSLLSTVKFFSSLETKMNLKIPNETFLRNTLYLGVCDNEWAIILSIKGPVPTVAEDFWPR